MSDKVSARSTNANVFTSTGPDVCLTPVGSDMVPVAYAQRFPGLIDAARLPDRGQTLAMAQRSRLDVDSARDAGRPPIVGVCYLWDGDVIAQEAPLRLDGAVDWDKATTWHHEPESFRPLAKQTPDGALLYIVNDHLGTPREMFGETGGQVWGAEYRLWGDIRRLWKPQARPANDNGGLLNPPAPRQPPAPRYSTRWDRLEQGNDAVGQPQPPPARPGPRGGRVYGNLALKDEAELADARAECPIRFQGQWEDSETGLYYNRCRYYDALSSQYLCPDPDGLQGGVRPQAYVESPQVFVDPLGLSRVFWTKIKTFKGKKVYQRDDLIDPNKVDDKGLTNLERMQNGLAPIGEDGKPLNIHHMLQTDDGPLAEMTQTFHQENYSNIHINAGSDIPSGIDRSGFDSWRRSYWKDRAGDF
jgi:RHS repeat-associated protein